MTMRIAACLVVLLLGAGCLDGGQGGAPGPTPTSSSASTGPTVAPPPPSSAPPVVDLLLGFTLEDCRGMSVRQSVFLADVQAILPPGFTAQADALASGAGTIVVDFYACGNLTVSSARVPATFYGQLSTPIEPPMERLPDVPDAAFHEYVFRVLAGEDVLAALWPAAGFETRGGEASMRVGKPSDAVPLDAGVHAAEGGIGQDYAFRAVGAVASATPVAGTFARYTALNDGSVLVWTGTYDFGGSYSGHGVAQLPDDDLFSRFEVAGFVGGRTILHEGGAMAGMDLRRVFTPP